MLSQVTVSSFFPEFQATDNLTLAEIAKVIVNFICENMHACFKNLYY